MSFFSQPKSQEICDIFLHENSVLCISVHPKQSFVFATACESGQISLYDLRCSVSDPIILASTNLRSRSYRRYSTDSDADSSSSSSSSSSSPAIQTMGGAFNSCHFNPVDPNLLVVANEKSGVSLIDIRMNSVLLRYKSGVNGSGGGSSSSLLATHSSETPAANENSQRRFDCNQNVMSVRFNRVGTQLVVNKI